MPRVVPSQVVTFIEELFPQFKPEVPDRSQMVGLMIEQCYKFQGVLDLVDQIPSELITLDNRDYSAFVSSVSAIRIVMANPKSRGHGMLIVRLEPISEFGNINPLAILRDLLSKCPDEFPGHSTSELQFITDQQLRQNLRNDLDAVNRALTNSEWKAATVLGGAVIEALLLWALQSKSDTDIATAANVLAPPRVKKKLDVKSILSWYLPDYIEVAIELGITTPDTTSQLRLAKDFRNFIHPGRAIRLGQNCNRGTALSAIAGIELLVQDLSNHP